MQTNLIYQITRTTTWNESDMSILAVSTVIYPPSLFTVTSSLGMEELDRKVVVTGFGVATEGKKTLVGFVVFESFQKLLEASENSHQIFSHNLKKIFISTKNGHPSRCR